MEKIKVFLVEGFGEEFEGLLELKEDRIEFTGRNKNIVALSEKTDKFFYYEQISSIECKKTHSSSKLIISTTSEETSFENSGGVSFEEMEEFCRSANNRISTFENRCNPVVIVEEDVVDRIKEAAQLKEKGLISEEEFSELKKKILDN